MLLSTPVRPTEARRYQHGIPIHIALVFAMGDMASTHENPRH